MAGKQHRHGADPDLDRDRDRDQFCCSVCLDLLKEPVTIPCGHSYCRRCIDGCWDQEEKEEKEPSCPQCRGTFSPRPLLKRSALLAEVVEKLEKSSTWRPSPPPPPPPLPPPAAWGAPEDDDVNEKMCERHGEPRDVYCRTDGKCICRLCVLDEHEGHDAVSVALQKAETQGRLVSSQKEVRARVRQRRRELQLLSREEEDVTSCARTAMNDCDEMFAAMVDATRSRAADAKRLIALQEKAAAAQAGELRLRLQEDVGRLMSRDAELERLLHADDHAMIQSVSTLCDSPNVAFNVAPLRSFRDVTECVSELRCKLETVLGDAWPRVTTSVSYVDFSLPPAPTTRKDLLRYCRPLTLDGNSNYPYLHLIGDNLRVRPSPAACSARPERFTKWPQVLCREALSERCYWEVEGHARTLSAAVAYGDMRRTSDESQFGGDERSWCLEFTGHGFLFRHGGVETVVPGPGSKRVGVYLDYRAGTLCFYRVNPTVPLHRVRTAFTRPLYPGLGLNYEWYDVGVFAQLTKLWE